MTQPSSKTDTIAFVGGGNMAAAIIGGLLAQGRAPGSVIVLEPAAAVRETLTSRHGVRCLAEAGPAMAEASMVVWAVKPQVFQQAAAPCAPHVAGALQLSVMAGIRSDAIVRATGTERVIRAMPNTPALIGMGIAGLYARPAVAGTDRTAAEAVLEPTGERLWVEAESELDAVTALSGSGPAYVFYVIEALTDAARAMGLDDEQGRRLALATFAGATELARRSDDPPSVLRERVTSRGGTTHAAITVLEQARVKATFLRALEAARQRADELGREFG